MSGFHAPIDPALIRPERRLPVMVNLLGRGPVLLRRHLAGPAADLFDAQRAAYLAGRELCHACYLASQYGLLVPHETVVAWETARDELAFQLDCKITRSGATLTTTEGRRRP